MKRVLLVCVLLVFLFCSCQKGNAAPFLMVESILSQHPEIPFGTSVYHEAALAGQDGYMSPRLQSLLYDEGRGRELPEFDAVRAYAVVLSDGMYGAELHVFQMNTEADVSGMATILNRRVALLKRRTLYLFAPAAYEDYFVSSRVAVEGSYVFLLCTGQNETILRQLKDMI